jgi:5,10-methylenetetrahydromethanopterin reductase
MPLRQALEYAAVAKDVGYRRVWVGEDLLSREVFTYLSILALRTQGIAFGTGITSPFLRNLAHLASSTAALQELCAGRFTLGLGVGGIPELEKLLGERPRGVVKGLKEMTGGVRSLLRGKTITLTGRYAALRDFGLARPPTVETPIYLGVRGERLLALAGAIADGVILSGPTAYLRRALEIVEEASRDAGRDPRQVEKVLWNPLIAGRGGEEKASLVVATIAASLSDLPLQALEGEEGRIQEIREAFLSGDYTKASRLVTPTLLEELCVAGPEKEVAERIHEFHRMGFGEFIVGPPFGFSAPEVIRSLGREMGGG